MTPDDRRKWADDELAEWFRSRERAAFRMRAAEVGCVLTVAAVVAALVVWLILG